MSNERPAASEVSESAAERETVPDLPRPDLSELLQLGSEADSPAGVDGAAEERRVELGSERPLDPSLGEETTMTAGVPVRIETSPDDAADDPLPPPPTGDALDSRELPFAETWNEADAQTGVTISDDDASGESAATSGAENAATSGAESAATSGAESAATSGAESAADTVAMDTLVDTDGEASAASEAVGEEARPGVAAAVEDDPVEFEDDTEVHEAEMHVDFEPELATAPQNELPFEPEYEPATERSDRGRPTGELMLERLLAEASTDTPARGEFDSVNTDVDGLPVRDSVANEDVDEAPLSHLLPQGEGGELHATLHSSSPLHDLSTVRHRKRVMGGIVAVVATIGVGSAMFVLSKRTPSSMKQSTLAAEAAPSGEVVPAALTDATSQNAPTAPSAAKAVASAEVVAPPAPEEEIAEPESPRALFRLEARVESEACQVPESEPAGVAESARALKRGRAAVARGDAAAAKDAFCLAAFHNPQNYMVQVALVQALMLLNDPKAAVATSRQAVQRFQSVQVVQEVHADALARNGDVEEATAQLKAALRLKDSDDEKLALVASSYVRAAKKSLASSDSARAVRFYRRAILMNPESSEAAMGLARVLLILDEDAAALGWARRAVTLQPEDVSIHVALGDVLVGLGRSADAKESYERALSIQPSHPEAKRKLLGVTPPSTPPD